MISFQICRHSCAKFLFWLHMPLIVLQFFTFLLVLHIQHVILLSGLYRFKRSLFIFPRNCLITTNVVRRLITRIRCRPWSGKLLCFRMDCRSLHLWQLAKLNNRICSAIMLTSLKSTIYRSQAVIFLNAICTLVFERQFVVSWRLRLFKVGILWISMQWVLSSQVFLPTAITCTCMKAPAGY